MLLSELYKLSKLIWQNKKCCDYKSWNIFFFYSAHPFSERKRGE